jgi:hypothetical protein
VLLCLLGLAAGVLRGELAHPLGGDSADAAKPPIASRQRAEHDRDWLQLDRRPGAGRGDVELVVAGGPRLGAAVHGAAAAVVGAPAAAAGGGLLVIVGVLIAALAAPAFLGYRVQRFAGQPLRCTKTS